MIIRFFSRIYKKALYHLSFPAYSRGIDVFNMSILKIQGYDKLSLY